MMPFDGKLTQAELLESYSFAVRRGDLESAVMVHAQLVPQPVATTQPEPLATLNVQSVCWEDGDDGPITLITVKGTIEPVRSGDRIVYLPRGTGAPTFQASDGTTSHLNTEPLATLGPNDPPGWYSFRFIGSDDRWSGWWSGREFRVSTAFGATRYKLDRCHEYSQLVPAAELAAAELARPQPEPQSNAWKERAAIDDRRIAELESRLLQASRGEPLNSAYERATAAELRVSKLEAELTAAKQSAAAKDAALSPFSSVVIHKNLPNELAVNLSMAAGGVLGAATIGDVRRCQSALATDAGCGWLSQEAVDAKVRESTEQAKAFLEQMRAARRERDEMVLAVDAKVAKATLELSDQLAEEKRWREEFIDMAICEIEGAASMIRNLVDYPVGPYPPIERELPTSTAAEVQAVVAADPRVAALMEQGAE